VTIAIALGPLLLTPLVVWLLMEYGPERSVVFAAYWLVLIVAFAVAMPLFRRSGRSLARASVLAVVAGLLVTAIVFVGLLFAVTPRA
jgi:hypothetical protein